MPGTKKVKNKSSLIRWSIVLLAVLAILVSCADISDQNHLPDGFVYVTDEIPTAFLRYDILVRTTLWAQ